MISFIDDHWIQPKEFDYGSFLWFAISNWVLEVDLTLTTDEHPEAYGLGQHESNIENKVIEMFYLRT